MCKSQFCQVFVVIALEMANKPLGDDMIRTQRLNRIRQKKGWIQAGLTEERGRN